MLGDEEGDGSLSRATGAPFAVSRAASRPGCAVHDRETRPAAASRRTRAAVPAVVPAVDSGT